MSLLARLPLGPVFLLSSAALAFAAEPTAVSASPKAPAAAKPMLGSTVWDWNALGVRPNANGVRRDVAENPTSTLTVFECHITTLNPGKASHAPHRHAQEELIIVKEGTLEVHIEGRTQVAGAGSVFFYQSNDAHAVRNVGPTPATYWVINLATAVTHTPAAHNAAPTLRSGVFDWAKLKVGPTKTGERRAILKGSTLTMNDLSCHATTVNAGDASHAAHRHADDEILIVKEGTVEVLIEGKTQRIGPGSLALFASNELHGMRNVGDTRATYYVIRMITTATPKAAGK